MSKKKQIVLTIIIGILILLGIYCIYLNIFNIIYLKNLTHNIGNSTAYKDVVEIWTQALYTNNTYLKSVLMLLFGLVNVLIYTKYIIKLWKRKT